MKTGYIADWREHPELKGLRELGEIPWNLNALREKPLGERIYVGDRGVYYIVQNFRTKRGERGNFEAHRKFHDLHVIIGGREAIYHRPGIKGLKVRQRYDGGKDVALFISHPSMGRRILGQGMFMHLAPHEPHQAKGCVSGRPSNVLKVVVKVPKRLIMVRGKPKRPIRAKH